MGSDIHVAAQGINNPHRMASALSSLDEPPRGIKPAVSREDNDPHDHYSFATDLIYWRPPLARDARSS